MNHNEPCFSNFVETESKVEIITVIIFGDVGDVGGVGGVGGVDVGSSL